MNPPPSSSPGKIFYNRESGRTIDPAILTLFDRLKSLSPMNKRGPMSGRCVEQTTQMENFLRDNFGFKNHRDEWIVPGVRSFTLSRPVETIPPDTSIVFPSQHTPSKFITSIPEILEWQSSFMVFADRNIEGMSEEFLRAALQGKSRDGEEAFRMKFVVRISTCPILMSFDGEIIDRMPTDFWPNRIKLVSVTGIDFAGRQHDYGDILYYIKNWKNVFVLDPRTSLPFAHNQRDFVCQTRDRVAILRRDRVQNDLLRMARLRLSACDRVGVHVVVETGIGLGVFAGRQLGIDNDIRRYSAEAIRTVLEHDGSSYQHIKAVVFALPIFNPSGRDTYHDFVEAFERSPYRGRIPVLILDQDMHKITVEIARRGFNVSELNPADSHGVFGEYWQNHGPAVEEKLALTTLGLLVQHHLINPKILNPTKYHLITTPSSQRLS